MQLFATPLSHFSRKVRILLDLYSLPYEFVDAGNVAEIKIEKFAGNPLMKVPALIDGENWIIESDHIAQYVVQTYDPDDRFEVKTKNIFDLNARAMINGIMSEEVKLILAKRTGLPVEQYTFFDKSLQAINSGLHWLEENHGQFNAVSPKYRDLHLVCLWDHLEYYTMVDLGLYPHLRDIVLRISGQAVVQQSAPHVVKSKT